MAMQKATIGTVLALALMGIVASALGALVATRTIPNTGNISVSTPSPSVQLGIYSDSACQTVLSSVTWGTLNPGAASSQTVYLRNEGNVPVTLSIIAGNWTPSAVQSYLTLTWNRSGYALSVGSIVQAVLTLNVSASITGVTSFSFDITISASQ